MKYLKYFFLTLVIVLSISLASCSNETNDNGNNNNNETDNSGNNNNNNNTHESGSHNNDEENKETVDITFEDATFTYDGKEHSIYIEGDLPEDVDVRYVNNNQVEVGKYDVVAIFEGNIENYDMPYTLEATLIIEASTSTKITHTVIINYSDDYQLNFTGNDGAILDARYIPIPEKKGYYTDWDHDLSKPITEDLIVNPVYEPLEFSIYYNIPEGIENNPNNPTSYTIESDDLELYPLEDSFGFKFLYWTLNGEKVTKIEKGTYGDLNLYPEAINCRINYVYGGSIDYSNEDMPIITIDATSSDYFYVDNYLDLPYDTTISYSYDLNGEYIKDSYIDLNGGDNTIYLKITSNQDETFYAIYELKLTTPYTVSFYVDGELSTSDTYYSNVIDSIWYEPSKEGYSFAGWSLDENETNLITLPYTLTSDINLYAVFIENTIEYEGNTFTFEIIDNDTAGILDVEVKKTTVICPDYIELDGKKYYITILQESLFLDNKIIQNLVLPSNIDVVSYQLCRGCSNLKTVTIPSGVTDIYNFAFYGCSLTSIALPDSLINIGYDAFSGCDFETVVLPDNVVSIDDFSFSDCSNLTAITIPNSVTSIADSAFESCSGLENVYYEGTIEDWFNIDFADANANPMYYAEHLYCNNELITSVTIPNDISVLGCNTLGLDDVKSVVLPNTILSISDCAFNGYCSLMSITIPDSVISIGSEAFYGCSSLASITIPNSLIYIGSSAFSDCSSLESITIPNSVTSIADDAFYNCSSLENVYYTGSVEDWLIIEFYDLWSNPMCYAEHFYMLDDNNEWYEVTKIEIPNTITSINHCQFYGFDNVSSITIPNSVTSIGNRAFSHCSSLQSIIIPGGVTNIGD